MRHEFDTGTPAVVLKLDHNVFHHGGLGVIRSLGRAGIPVYAVHEARWAPAAHSRYLRGRFLWNPDPGRPEEIVEGLTRLAERIGVPSVLIPTDDAGAILLAEHGDALRPWFRFPAVAADLPRQVAGKFSLTRLCDRLGLPVAAARLVRGQPEAQHAADRLGLPLIVKLAEPWRPANGARPRSTTLVRDHGELAELVGRAGDAGLMVQEYIPAGGDGSPADWFFHGYCDGDSRCVPGFTGVKERSYPPHAGLTSLGRAVPNDQLAAEVAALLRRLEYRGICDLDLRYDARDGSYKLLDFNPRIGAQFRLFADADGLDVVRAAHLDLTGRPVSAGEPVRDRRFLVENYDALAALGYLRRGELGVGSWLGSLRRVDETAWYAADDLAPFGLMCLRTAWRAVQRPLAKDRPLRTTGARWPEYRPGRKARTPRVLPADPPTDVRLPAAGAALKHHAAEPDEPPRDEHTPQSEGSIMTGHVDVAIVGAGPYGLSLAAHLRAAGVSHRIFGHPMRLWREAMPAGMFLKSQPFASNLSDPAGAATLRAFCEESGERYVPYGEPVSLDRFTRYGEWFRRTQVPQLEEQLVTGVQPTPDGFKLKLDNGETVRARRVVIAAGVEHFAYVPPPLDSLPPELCTHVSAHTDLSGFAGRDVTVVGAGQSALETAALAAEAGAEVRVVARRPRLAWNGAPLPDERPLTSKLAEPEAALGSGWSTWFYSNQPALFRRLPARQRVRIARTALGPAGAHWLRPRLEGKIPVLASRTVTGAEPHDGGVRLTLRHSGGGESDLVTGHVIAGTGYRPDLARFDFLDESMAAGVRTLGGGPAVGGDFQSSVPGLYFVGPAVASSFGPVMRFVHGCDFVAKRLSRRLAATAPTNGRTAASTARTRS